MTILCNDVMPTTITAEVAAQASEKWVGQIKKSVP